MKKHPDILPDTFSYALFILAGVPYLGAGPGHNGLRGIRSKTMAALVARGWAKRDFNAAVGVTLYEITPEGARMHARDAMAREEQSKKDAERSANENGRATARHRAERAWGMG